MPLSSLLNKYMAGYGVGPYAKTSSEINRGTSFSSASQPVIQSSIGTSSTDYSKLLSELLTTMQKTNATSAYDAANAAS